MLTTPIPEKHQSLNVFVCVFDCVDLVLGFTIWKKSLHTIVSYLRYLQGGIQAAETMLFTVDMVNKAGLLPHGLTLGVIIKDDCDRDTYGLEQSTSFIKGKTSEPYIKMMTE